MCAKRGSGLWPALNTGPRARPPYVIEIRGAGGSGKSTVARRVMQRYASAREIFITEPIVVPVLGGEPHVWWGHHEMVVVGGDQSGFKATIKEGKTLGHELERHHREERAFDPDEERRDIPLFAVGKYGVSCGGVDSIYQMDIAYELVRRWHERGFDVLAEGKVLSHSHNDRPLQFREHLIAVHIETTSEAVVAATVARRAARGWPTDADREAKIKRNSEGEVRAARSFARRLGEAGAEVFSSTDRDAAVAYAIQRLGLDREPETPFELIIPTQAPPPPSERREIKARRAEERRQREQAKREEQGCLW